MLFLGYFTNLLCTTFNVNYVNSHLTLNSHFLKLGKSSMQSLTKKCSFWLHRWERECYKLLEQLFRWVSQVMVVCPHDCNSIRYPLS